MHCLAPCHRRRPHLVLGHFDSDRLLDLDCCCWTSCECRECGRACALWVDRTARAAMGSLRTNRLMLASFVGETAAAAVTVTVV